MPKNTITTFVLLLCLTVCSTLRAEASSNISEMEEALQTLFVEQMQSPDEEKSTQIYNSWVEILKNPEVFNFSFEKLSHCSILDSQDAKIRVITWADPVHHPHPKHYGFVLKREEKTETFTNTELVYKQQFSDPKQILSNQEWYGAIYYKIIDHEINNKTYYTLLGWSPFNRITNKKMIDVLHFSSNNLKLGAPIFTHNKEVSNRIFFNYSKQTSMTLNYHKKEIVFDHLAPSSPEFTGLYQFYGPDMSFDKYVWKKEQWERIENVTIKE